MTKSALYFTHSFMKIFPEDRAFPQAGELSCFENGSVSFQLAAVNGGLPLENCRLEVKCGLSLEVRRVGFVPAEFSDHPEGDDYVIGKGLHLFPDPLFPFGLSSFQLKGNCTNVFFVTVKEEKKPVGSYPVWAQLFDKEGNLLGEASGTVRVTRGVLPELPVPVTDWMHYDCIANYYHEQPFTPRFFTLCESFWRMAADHGINTVYVPLFTPPLDTKPGGERTTVQLVGVRKEGERYSFVFELLAEFLKRADRAGMKYFELSHLFTQWGAQAAPKIVAKTEGTIKRIFGWDTPADGQEYTAFLEAFLPALGAFLKEKGYTERCFLHISDEPSEYWLKDYAKRRALVKRLLPEVTHIDAISDSSIAQQGLVDIPVASTDHAEAFLGKGKPFWAYYCWPQCGGYLSNRMMNMPPERTRILGMQLYESGAGGFLHWGYNFYNTALSLRSVDPFFETDAGGCFPAGDAFSVYPGIEGALSSLRLEYLKEGWEDYRALFLLEQLTGREKVLSLLHGEGVHGFTCYPHGSEAFLRLRRAIEGAVERALAQTE